VRGAWLTHILQNTTVLLWVVMCVPDEVLVLELLQLVEVERGELLVSLQPLLVTVRLHHINNAELTLSTLGSLGIVDRC